MAKWYSIGILLGIDHAKLNEFEMNHRTADRCFIEMINFWLNNNTRVTRSWTSLVEILELDCIGEEGLAGRLREMIVSEAVGIPGAAESEVQPQEIIGEQRGNALDDNSNQQPERQGA